MAFDETLAQRVRAALSGRARTEELQMFGGLAFTVNGHVCCGIVGHDLMLRVGPERYAMALSRPHARKMDFTGRPLNGMVYVAPQGLRRGASLKNWLDMALDFVTTLKPKSKTQSRKRTVAAKRTTSKLAKTTKKPAAKKSTKKARAKKESAAKAKRTKPTPKKSKATAKKRGTDSSVKKASKPPASKKLSSRPPGGTAKKAVAERTSTRPPSKRSQSARPAKKPSIKPPGKKGAPPTRTTAAGSGRVTIRPAESSTRQSLRPRSLLPIGPFTGFPQKTLRYLKDLRAHNEKTWFDEHRGHYESFYLKPALEFIAAVGPKLRTISPDVQFEPRINGSLFRIQRDVRFSKDKTPYKPHLDLWFWHGDRKNWSTPGYFFRLEPKKLTVGGGTHRFEVTQLSNFREAVVDAERGSELEQTLSEVSAHKRVSVGGATRKAVPRGFDPDHHRAHLLLHEGLYAAYEGPAPASLHDAKFVDWCVAEFSAISPLVDWLLRL